MQNNACYIRMLVLTKAMQGLLGDWNAVYIIQELLRFKKQEVWCVI
jgi:hypothetical protein